MKISNSYRFVSSFNVASTFFGKGINLLKNVFSGDSNKDGASARGVINCDLNGKFEIDVSVEELMELQKQYEEDFIRTVNFLKSDLRPVCREIGVAISEGASEVLHCIHDLDEKQRKYDERVAEEREAKEAAKEKKSKKSE